MSYPKRKGFGPLQWLEYVLYSDAFTIGELQSGYTYMRPAKDSHGNTVLVPVHVPGTRIPASTLYRFREGFWVPRERSLEKLYAFYRRWAYHQLRASGLSTSEAKANVPRRDPMQVWDTVRKMRTVAETIAANKGIDVLDVMASIQKSDIAASRWDRYVKSQKYHKSTPEEAQPPRIVRNQGFEVVRYDPARGVYIKPWHKENINRARKIFGRKNIITIKKPVHEMRTRRSRGKATQYRATVNPGLVLVKIDAF